MLKESNYQVAIEDKNVMYKIETSLPQKVKKHLEVTFFNVLVIVKVRNKVRQKVILVNWLIINIDEEQIMQEKNDEIIALPLYKIF